MAESANFKGGTFIKYRNGLIGNRLEMPNVSYTNPLAASVFGATTTMRQTIKILIMGLLSVLFGCRQSNKTVTTDTLPKESFSVIEAKIGEKPVIGSFNMVYKSFDKKLKYPWCLKIAIGLDLANLYENGLPKDEESVIANKLEDELLTEIKKIATAHYIGHLFNDTFLDVYIYLDNPEKVHQYLQTQVNKAGLIRGFGYEINQDPTWTTVNGFLK